MFNFVRIQSLYVSYVHGDHIHTYKIKKQPWKRGIYARENWHFSLEIALIKLWKLVQMDKLETCGWLKLC